MGVRYYDKVYIREAGTYATSIAKNTLSSWNKLPTGAKVTQELSLKTEPDVSTAMGDGTDLVGSEAANAEMQFVGWGAEDLSRIRTALINKKVDILVTDSRNTPDEGWAIFGIQLYPTPEIGGNKENIIRVTGKARYASDTTQPAMVPVTLT